jgi:hypothetical protein
MARKGHRSVSSLRANSKNLTKISARARADAGELRAASRKLRRKCADLINMSDDQLTQVSGGAECMN